MGTFAWKGKTELKYRCAAGFTLSADKTACIKADDVVVIATPAAHLTYQTYGLRGTVFYKPGYNVDGTWDIHNSANYPDVYGGYQFANHCNFTGISQGLWSNYNQSSATTGGGRMNECALWKQGNPSFMGTLGFTKTISVSSDATYLIGVGADNNVVVKMDGNIIFAPVSSTIGGSDYFGNTDSNYTYWSVIPVYLSAGAHTFNIAVENISGSAGSDNPGAIALEIYNATESQLMACVTDSDLSPYIYFSTKDVTDGTDFDVSYSCNPGYILTRQEDGSYACIQTGNPPVQYQ